MAEDLAIPEGADLAGRRFVLTGLSRLAVRVAGMLHGRGATVVVTDALAGTRLAQLLPEGIQVIAGGLDRDTTLHEAGLSEADGLLALSDDDLENLSTAVTAHAVAPDVPVVLRAYDLSLADEFERGLNVRRSFSVSALAAPALLLAALKDPVIETLRLGDQQVLVCRITVNPGSRLAGRTPSELERAYGCQAIARRGREHQAEGGDGWIDPPDTASALAVGDALVVGGPVTGVLRLALEDERLFDEQRAHRGSRPAHTTPDHGAPRGRQSRPRQSTLLPVTAVILTIPLVITLVIFALALHLGPVEALYLMVTTALGNSTLDDRDAWLKVLGVVSMILGGALIGVLFSYLASVATAQRLESKMGKRAQRLAGHAVVAGLGTVGYRLEQLLHDLGIKTAVIDRSPDARFVEAVGVRSPMLTGDARLTENLERAGIRRAACIFACTDDDLANLEACLQARRLNPGIVTVARIFDDQLDERLGSAFGIGATISTTRVAARAFVGAAVELRASRTFHLGHQAYLAFRHEVRQGIEAPTLAGWRHRGVHVIAFRRGRGAVGSPAELPHELAPGDSVIVTGRAGLVKELLG